jgi:hypothetical protein
MSDDKDVAAEAAKQKADAEAKAKAELLELAQKSGVKIYEESVVKDIIAGRDEAKRKLREREEADKKASEAKMIEEGKLKDLLAQRDAELAQERQTARQLQERADAFEAQQKAIRDAALNKITDAKLRAIAEKLPSPADVVEFVELHTTNKAGVDGTKGIRSAVGGDDPYKLRPGENALAYQTRLRAAGLWKE